MEEKITRSITAERIRAGVADPDCKLVVARVCDPGGVGFASTRTLRFSGGYFAKACVSGGLAAAGLY